METTTTSVSSIRESDGSIPATSLCGTLGASDERLGVYTVTQIDLEPRDDLHESNRVAHLYLELDRGIVDGTPSRLESEFIVTINVNDESEPPVGDTALSVGEQILLRVQLQDGDPTTALVNHLTVTHQTEDGWSHRMWGGCTIDEDTLRERIPAMSEYIRNYDPNGQLEFDCPGDVYEINPANPLVRDCSL